MAASCCVCGVALTDYDEREDGICQRFADEGYIPDTDGDEGYFYDPSRRRVRDVNEDK
jgi:hypothetical protein